MSVDHHTDTTQKRRKVLAVSKGRLKKGPADEIWICCLECGCSAWRMRVVTKSRGGLRGLPTVYRAPTNLFCQKHPHGEALPVAPDEAREAVRELQARLLE